MLLTESGPVRPDPDPAHVRDDQQGEVLERERVLPQPVERGDQARVIPFVLLSEAATLPALRSSLPAGALEGAVLEAVVVPLGSASAGVGSQGNRPRSIKCSRAAERSLNSEACHFATNSADVTPRTLRFTAGRHSSLQAVDTLP